MKRDWESIYSTILTKCKLNSFIKCQGKVILYKTNSDGQFAQTAGLQKPFYEFAKESDATDFTIISLQDLSIYRRVEAFFERANKKLERKTYRGEEFLTATMDQFVLEKCVTRENITIHCREMNIILHVSSDLDQQWLFDAARIIREVMTRLLERSLFFTFHAGAIKVGNCGVLISGTKGTGKSTTTLAMLEHNGYEFVGNDCVYVGSSNNDNFLMCGWPIAAAIRYGTCFASNQIREWLIESTMLDSRFKSAKRQFEIMQDMDVSARWNEKRYYELTPRQIVEAFKTRISSGIQLSHIIFPMVGKTAQPTIEIPTKTWAKETLMQENNTLFAKDYSDRFGLGIREEALLKAEIENLIDKILQRIPFVKVAYSNYSDVHKGIVRFLGQ